MSKPKCKYFLNPGVSGDLHTKAPSYERKDGGKFVLSKDELTQQDLEYLFEEMEMNQIISKVSVAGSAPEDKGNGKKKTKDAPQ